MKEQCVNCGRIEDRGQFWTLKNYFGLSGTYCADCYKLVSHDGWGRPKNQTEYLMILLKQESRHGKEKKS